MLKFGAGFFTGFVALFALIMVFGDYGDAPVVATIPPAVVAQAVQPDNAPAAIPQESGPSYAAVCKPDTNNMTDPQITAYAQRWIGQRFSGWQGYVFDVVSNSDGTYDLEIAMEERGFLWTRDLVIENIVSDLAQRLNVEQRVMFSGRVASVDTVFDIMCAPLIVDNYVLQE